MQRMTKRGFVMTLLALAVMSFLGSAAFAAGSMKMNKEASVTVKGEILDMACYLGHGAMGMKHQQCALMCLKGGQPMGLRTADGKVYLLVASHTDSKPFEEAKGFAADQVEVTGPLFQRDGISAIEVDTVKKL
ncbi:MAG: hypothetical protein ACP5VF_03215 [Acidobacteriota bacterium]